MMTNMYVLWPVHRCSKSECIFDHSPESLMEEYQEESQFQGINNHLSVNKVNINGFFFHQCHGADR